MTKIYVKIFQWLLGRTDIHMMTFEKTKWKLIETENLIIVKKKDYEEPPEFEENFYADNNPYYTVSYREGAEK